MISKSFFYFLFFLLVPGGLEMMNLGAARRAVNPTSGFKVFGIRCKAVRHFA